MLNKEICKKCKNINAKKYVYTWINVDEDDWENKKLLYCTLGILTGVLIEPPLNCLYRLEHIVTKGLIQ
jgi:hypothetical protein